MASATNFETTYSSQNYLTYSPDPDDNLILATAIAGLADYIVSGDKGDMLALNVIENIPIITARRAIEILEGNADFD